MSVNWGQFDEIGMYCSDRLPISLACGVPHITNYQPGYEHVYANIPGLFIVKSPREAADVAIYLLSLNIDTRIELGLQALDYARRKLHASVVYADIAAIVEETFFSEDAHAIK
jgi:spore maturation protein CgeB